MKRLKLFFACMLLTVFSIGQVWATDVTYTLTINASDFNTTSYAANNNEKTSNAVCTSDNTKTYEVKWTSNQVMKNGNNMQWQKSKGYIFNSTDLGTISSVTVNSSAGSFTTYYGTSEHPTSGTTVGNGYFTTSVGGATGTTSSIVVTFVISESGGGSDPSLSVSPSSWDFGTVHVSATASKVFSVSGSNLTAGNLTLTVPTGFSVSPSTIAVDGTLDATNVTVSKNTSTIDDYSGDLSISGGGLSTAKTVALTMTVDADPAPTGTFELFSGDLEEGDYVLVSTNALSNTVNSNRIAAEVVTIEDDKIVNPSTSIIWHIAPVSETEYWTIYNAVSGKYAGGTSTKNQGALLDEVADLSKWIVSGNSTYDFANYGRSQGSDPNNKYLRYNSTTNNINSRWGCYGTGTGGALTLYKLADGKPKAPTFSPAAGTYTEAQNVTISCATDGVTIYYTTDGTTPTTNSSVYSTAISVSQTTTIKAIAVKDSKSSSVATATYTITEPLNTMDKIFAAATAAGGTAADVTITFGNWVVSAITSNNAFVTDGTKGFIIYANSHGFVVGNTLSGTVSCKVQLYKGAAELTNLTASTSGLTVVTGGTVSVNTTTIDQLGAINTGAVVTIENLDYDGTDLSDGTNTIKPYNKLFAYTMESGKKYNVTGVVDYYDALQIMPRSAADIEEVTAAGAPEAPTFSPAAGTYTEAQNVTISCATDGVTIYYTTDGTTPTTNSSVYSTPISVSADMTIRAIAVKNDLESALASATYVLNVPLTTIDAIFNKATIVGSTATDVTVVLNNWIVSGVKGSNAFVTDGTKGFVIYANSHGFSVGDVLSGTVACKVQLYKGSAELTSLTSSTEGLSVTAGGTAAVNTQTIDQLGAINTGAVVTIENVTYDGTNLSDGTNNIKPYNGLYSSMAFESGNDYNVTGVVNYYDALQIMPRNADDIENLTIVPVTSLSLTESTTGAEVEVGSTVTLHASVEPSNATNKTINWSVQSGSDYASVADGVVTGIAAGTAVIRATSDADNTKYAECTVTVTAVDPTKKTATFDATVDKTTENTDLSITKSNLTIAITDGDGRFNNGTDYRIYKNAEFTVSCSAGNITKIEFTCNSSNPLSGFADATGLDKDNNVWTGNAASVAFTASNKQVQIKNLTITYKEDSRAESELAWSTDAVELTVGETFTAPTLSNPNNIAASEITISSSNTNLATVNNGVVELVADATGTTTIKATFAGNDDYKPAIVSYTITVNQASPVLTDYYEKVASGSVAEGTYLIVYEAGNVAFNGGLTTLDAASNTIAVEITNDHKIGVTTETEAATFYIDPTAGTIKSASGRYIGRTANSNGLNASETEAYTNTISIDNDGNAVIVGSGSTATYLRYNSNSGQTRFRYFTANQQPIALYKLANEVIKPAAGLAWDPADDIEITVGETFTAPTLSNPNNIAASEITISSSNTNLATVNNGVVELVADATGTTTIKATFAGNDDYKAAEVSYKIKVNPASSIYVSPGLNVNFGSVEKDATALADQTITVTLNNVASATATLGGTNPTAFSVDKTALVEGDNVITISVASTATVGEFKATLTISDDAGAADSKEVKLSFTVTDPAAAETPVATTTKWVPATAADLVDGKVVLITGTKESTTYAMGEQKTSNRAAVAASVDGEGVLTPGENTMAFTLVDQGNNTFALRTADGQYLYAASSSANQLKKRAAVGDDNNANWTVAVDALTANGSNRGVMQFNYSTNNQLFSCYASASSSYIAIKLYVPQPAPTPTKDLIRDGLTNGKWGTICPKQTVENVEGAKFYQISYLEEQNGVPFNMVWDEISGTTLTAGQPYFFIANATEIRGNKTSTVATSGSHVNGFYGYIGDENLDLPNWHINYEPGNDNTFVIYNNKVTRIDGATELYSERCYININSTEPTRQVKPQQSAALHRLVMGISGADAPAVTTGINEITNDQMTNKVIINGHLFIIRGEKMFDATGRLVK